MGWRDLKPRALETTASQPGRRGFNRVNLYQARYYGFCLCNSLDLRLICGDAQLPLYLLSMAI
jgi:hypothetical protein